MEDIVIEELKLKAYKIFFGGCIMLLSSILIWIVGVSKHSLIYISVGVISTVFMGIGTLVVYLRIAKEKPLLTIKLDGIIDSSSASAVGFIEYGDIDSFEIVNLFGVRMIGVSFNNAEDFVKKLSKGKQRAARMNMKMNYPPISLRLDTAKDISIEDIYSMLQKRLADYKRLYH